MGLLQTYNKNIAVLFCLKVQDIKTPPNTIFCWHLSQRLMFLQTSKSADVFICVIPHLCEKAKKDYQQYMHILSLKMTIDLK